ncbi:MAG: hypothetical protein C4541_04705 [Candidatus Auribacter fodinae]|jgi:hypothetical protein|uniref:Tetratricopeptide repeat protein n=1 Tax=Candidatus Auribacter fodinae TaxID=2093366 RepID=A0A3A4R534_9BACT|nr:MAG: hypothetical protein C4541_04705 [Candidatus Auribacter fodinae]
MRFLEKIFGKKIENENRSKPFYQNKNDIERLDWFKRTRPWHQVDERIISAFINKFSNHGDGEGMFEVFVVFSMKHGLVHNYCNLKHSEVIDSPELICSIISQQLYNIGTVSLKELLILIDDLARNKEKFKHHYSIVMDAFETAVILDDKQFSAYANLAIAKMLLNKFDESLQYAMKGLYVIREIKKLNIPFHLSKSDEIKNAKENIEEAEDKLSNLVLDLQNKLRD